MVRFLLNHVIIGKVKNYCANLPMNPNIIMRTDKHKLKPLSPTQEKEFLELAYAYLFEKNYWSDKLLKREGVDNESKAFLKNLYTYRQIRDSNNLTKKNYSSRYHLPVRYCTIALKEAYDLHIRTYESQIAFLKNKINNKIYQFKITENIANQAAADGYDEIDKADVALHIFKEFLHFVTNSLFYNYQTFRTFEEEFYSKGFRKAREYTKEFSLYYKNYLKKQSKKKFLR